MAAQVSLDSMKADSYGKTFGDVFKNSTTKRALVLAIEIMNDPAKQRAMVDAVLLHRKPPLVGCVKAIEDSRAFFDAMALTDKGLSDRLKNAIGVACKLVMAELGFVPLNLENGNPAMGFLNDKYSKYFTTARKFKRVK